MIVFIEDELLQTASFHDEFRLSGYEVALLKTSDEAMTFLRENVAAIRLVILDIMMSPGELLKDVDTMRGLRTGVKLFERIREEFPTLTVVIFTNVTNTGVKEFFNAQNVLYLHKSSNDPHELVEKVEKVLQVSRS